MVKKTVLDRRMDKIRALEESGKLATKLTNRTLRKVLSNKLFRDELAKQNVVMLSIKIKPEMPKNAKERPKKIDLKGMKDAERIPDFLNKP